MFGNYHFFLIFCLFFVVLQKQLKHINVKVKELPHAEISQSCCHFARQKNEKRKVSLIVTLSKVTCMTSINASTTNYTCVSDKVPTSNT